MPDNRTKSQLLKIPPYIILGAILISLPIVFFITYQNIIRQQSHTQVLLLEKGAALIRSFEAGTRAGMRGRLWGNRKLQQLLEETAQQSDIVYIAVTDDNGLVTAHNQIDNIRSLYGENLDLKAVITTPKIHWRIIERGESQRIFEVYRRFIPTGMPGNPDMERTMRRFRGRTYPFPGLKFHGKEPKQVIFIGLDMISLDEAGKSTVMNSIITGLLIFLAGSTGIVLLFLFQNYQSTKASLSRIKAFSDHLVSNMPIGFREYLLCTGSDQACQGQRGYTEAVGQSANSRHRLAVGCL